MGKEEEMSRRQGGKKGEMEKNEKVKRIGRTRWKKLTRKRRKKKEGKYEEELWENY
jgi:hypothetical protein